MPSEPIAITLSTVRKGIVHIAQFAGRVGDHRLNDIANKRTILHTARRKARGFVAAPDDYIGRRLDFVHLVAIDDLLITREIHYARAAGAQCLPDRKQHRITESASNQQRGLSCRCLRRCARRTHQHNGFAWFQQYAKVGRSTHLQYNRRQQSALAIDRCAG